MHYVPQDHDCTWQEHKHLGNSVPFTFTRIAFSHKVNAGGKGSL